MQQVDIQKSTPSLDKLQLLLVERFKHVEVAMMEEVLIQGFEKTSAEDFKPSFYFANKDIKSAFLRFLKTALDKTIHQATLNFISTKSFDRLRHLTLS